MQNITADQIKMTYVGMRPGIPSFVEIDVNIQEIRTSDIQWAPINRYRCEWVFYTEANLHGDQPVESLAKYFAKSLNDYFSGHLKSGLKEIITLAKLSGNDEIAKIAESLLS